MSAGIQTIARPRSCLLPPAPQAACKKAYARFQSPFRLLVELPPAAPRPRPARQQRKRLRRWCALRRFGGELLALFDRLFDGADHVEGLLGQVVVLAFAKP